MYINLNESHVKIFLILGLLLIAVALDWEVVTSTSHGSDQDDLEWRRVWAVEDGFSISIDSVGFHLPTALAFVRNPGPEPDDVLYYVTELEGKIKAVTNDRSVHVFAEDFFRLELERDLSAGEGQAGLAGICLDDKHGYVFATHTYQDDQNILRNNVVRFETTPESFSIKPSGKVEFTEIFSAYESGLAHQIGGCQVYDDHIYVSIGDGWQPLLSQDFNSLNGKVIRLSVDGSTPADNPFIHDPTAKTTGRNQSCFIPPQKRGFSL
jgi:glucose/arabinose dehydrogenase